MPTLDELYAMSDDELYTLIEAIRQEQERREDQRLDELINNLEQAITAFIDAGYDIEYTKHGFIDHIHNIDNFNFSK